MNPLFECIRPEIHDLLRGMDFRISFDFSYPRLQFCPWCGVYLKAEKRIEALNGDNFYEAMNFSVRVKWCLHRRGIVNIHDLMKVRKSELMTIKNFGITSMEELDKKLSLINLELQP